MKPMAMILAFAVLFVALGLSFSSLAISGARSRTLEIFIPHWTRSYQLYKQPHAVWLDQYETVGANLETLNRTLEAAENVHQVPELVIYAIPLRDLGQSSEGGFSSYTAYLDDNRLNAERVKAFVQETGMRPRIYLEPDSIPLAVQYRQDQTDSPASMELYHERIKATRQLIRMYRDAGAIVYLEAGHSGWFDYGDEDIQRIAKALNEAGIEQANGLASNVSNRQPVNGSTGRTERHYLARLLPVLENANLDVVVDTGRNGGSTKARTYHLSEGGKLFDNEFPTGRLVGRWRRNVRDEIWLHPFFGPKKPLSKLLKKEKYTFDSGKMLLTAPPWLDAVGDVKLGPSPTDNPPASVAATIQRFRYIKPPDDCDGALNCPPGKSKHDINVKTAERQLQGISLSPNIWSGKA